MSRLKKNPILKFLEQRQDKLSPLVILTHNHPDPDAMASAWALAYLAQKLHGIRCRILYGGIIGRMENKTMVKILRIPARAVTPKTLASYPHVALIDTQPPFQNNIFPARRQATMVIDHHPRHARTKSEFTLIDKEAGATATLLGEALLDSGLPVSWQLATALLYGIGSETQHLGRESISRDRGVYRGLFPMARMRVLSKIENPPRPDYFFFTLGKAIRKAFTVRAAIGVHLGTVPNHDIVAQMADFLLSHEKMRWSIVTGRYKGRFFVSLRTKNRRAQAGKLLWRLLGGGTAAGGHGMIAGGSLAITEKTSEGSLRKTEEDLTNAFLKKLGYKEPFELQYPYRSMSDAQQK